MKRQKVEMVYSQCGSCGYEGPEFKLGKVLAITHDGKKIRARHCPTCGKSHSTCTEGLWGF